MSTIQGELPKWGTILEAFDIKYMPYISVKGQVLADLVAKFAEMPSKDELEKRNIDEKSIGVITLQECLPWMVYVDVQLTIEDLGWDSF